MNRLDHPPYSAALPSPHPPLPPFPPPSRAFWEPANVIDRLKELYETIKLAEAMGKELEVIDRRKTIKGDSEGLENLATPEEGFFKLLCINKIDLKCQELLSLEAANALISKLKTQLEPFRVVVDDRGPWEEKSSAIRLCDQLQKYKRNKLWRKKKRKRVAEKLAMEKEKFEQLDKEADEWMAREIAKDVAKQKVAKMKEIAKLKEKEERKTLGSELELALMVEKLQELRSIRIQKLKKQGRFLPDEDDQFLERVKAAVEEEERLAMAAAGTAAAKDAIATAESSRKLEMGRHNNNNTTINNNNNNNNNMNIKDDKKSQEVAATMTKPEDNKPMEHNQCGRSSSAAATYVCSLNLPMEYYHYYYGSNHDIGTLVEVRRRWDAYLRSGGSRIPGHWVQPPPPADQTWASCLLKP
ncbi:unnamed protein product [Cuscuta epithymum]|uniref:Uncharacterized protein n=1 Tax=Cuscuta epithymum TaxID=186058 RepID=A0AAV0CU70_9ASTE|nr:unnamed protein product [Cuscuta epithymum]CAH9122847.1 unnamed protein product [Cuscuta epithymum]